MTNKLLHVLIRGWTATFRLPLLYSGTGLTSPVPPYCTLLGMIGCIAARDIKPYETKIGYYFKSDGTAIDLERTKRLQLESKEKTNKATGKRYIEENIIPNTMKGDGIAKRQFHIRPELHLYLDNLEFKKHFEKPENIPTLGRSQDLVWIEVVEEVQCEERKSGVVSGTLLPFPTAGASGIILLLPDWFDNDDTGYTRSIGKMSQYITVKSDVRANVAVGNLYAVERREELIYMHNLI